MSETTTVGALIDRLIRVKYEQQKPPKPKNNGIQGLPKEDGIEDLSKKDGIEGLTQYIEEVLTKDLSKRQIDTYRDRKNNNIPKQETIADLAEKIPAMEVLNLETICGRLLVPFDLIESDQKDLSKKAEKNTITIVAGWQPPLSIKSEIVADSIVHNIRNGFEYEFIFPDLNDFPNKDKEQAKTLLKRWLAQLLNTLKESWSSQESQMLNQKIESDGIESIGSNELINYREKLMESIKFFSTTKNDSVTQFWLLMPSRYVLLYNIKGGTESTRYGNFLVEGVLDREEIKGFPEIKSSGWLYLTQQQYKEIQAEYRKHHKTWTPIELEDSVIEAIFLI